MKKKEKRNILILIAVGLLIIGIIIAVKSINSNQGEENEVKEEYVKVLEDGTRLNVSEELNKAKTLEGLSFTNIQLTNKNNQSVLLADVKNESQSKTGIIPVKITILDKSGNELGVARGIVLPLEVGASTQFNTSTMRDYANAYDFRVERDTDSE